MKIWRRLKAVWYRWLIAVFRLTGQEDAVDKTRMKALNDFNAENGPFSTFF